MRNNHQLLSSNLFKWLTPIGLPQDDQHLQHQVSNFKTIFKGVLLLLTIPVYPNAYAMLDHTQWYQIIVLAMNLLLFIVQLSILSNQPLNFSNHLMASVNKALCTYLCLHFVFHTSFFMLHLLKEFFCLSYHPSSSLFIR